MALFSKRHYHFLAGVLRPFDNCPEKRGILEDLSAALAADNEHFDRVQFWQEATKPWDGRAERRHAP